LLVEIQALIEQRKFADENICSKEVYSDTDCNQKECAYIFHYLFDACVCCLLEIQADFANLFPQKRFTDRWGHLQYDREKTVFGRTIYSGNRCNGNGCGANFAIFPTEKDESFVRQYAHEKYLTFMDEVEFTVSTNCQK